VWPTNLGRRSRGSKQGIEAGDRTSFDASLVISLKPRMQFRQAGMAVAAILTLQLWGAPQVRSDLTPDLVEAAQAGDAARAYALIERGAPVNGRYELDTPLTAAVRNNRTTVVQMLMKHGADVNATYATSSQLKGHPSSGKKVWEQCSICHENEELGPRMKGLMSRRMARNEAPSYEALLHQLNEGGKTRIRPWGVMPAFKGILNEQEKADVLSYLILGDDPRVGHTAAELAEYSCVEPIVQLVGQSHSQFRDPVRREAPRSYPEVQQVFFDIQRYLCQAQRHFNNRTAAQRAEIARQSVTFLIDRWNRSDRENWTPSPYDESLDNIRLVAGLAANQADTKRADAMLTELQLDLASKEQDCRDGGAGMGRVIPVSVHTVNQKDVSGWQVLYKPKLLEFWGPAQFEPFPMLSSPSKWKLAPGRYLLIARKSGVESPPQPMTLTIGGKIETFECQIPVR